MECWKMEHEVNRLRDISCNVGVVLNFWVWNMTKHVYQEVFQSGPMATILDHISTGHGCAMCWLCHGCIKLCNVKTCIWWKFGVRVTAEKNKIRVQMRVGRWQCPAFRDWMRSLGIWRELTSHCSFTLEWASWGGLDILSRCPLLWIFPFGSPGTTNCD